MRGWRSAILGAALGVLAGCGPKGPAVYGTSVASCRAATVVDALSRGTLDSGAFSFHRAVISAPYANVFRAAVAVLNGQGDTVVQADSDKGYIVTARVQHGLVISVHQQYYVGFDVVSETQTEMVFKLFDWADMDTDNVTIVRLQPEPPDYAARYAGAFIEAVKAEASK